MSELIDNVKRGKIPLENMIVRSSRRFSPTSAPESRTAFDDFHGRFVHIEYSALRDSQGAYLAVPKRARTLQKKLTGEQRLPAYSWREQSHQ